MHNWQTTQKAATKRKAKLGQEFQPTVMMKLPLLNGPRGTCRAMLACFATPVLAAKGLEKAKTKARAKQKPAEGKRKRKGPTGFDQWR